MKRTGLFFMVCLALGATGCSLPARVSFRDRPEIASIRARIGKPADLTVAVAVPVQEEAPAAKDAKAGTFHARTDRAGFQKDIVEAFLSVGAFSEVVAVGDVSEQDSLESLLGAAREARADLLVVPRILRHEISFEGFTGWRIPNLVMWFYLWVPSFWIQDETFAVRTEAHFDVYSVHSGWKLGEYTAAGEARETLNDLQRGWIFAGILRVPGALEEENWKRVETVLGPRALDELRSDLVKKLDEQFLPSVGSPEFHEKTRKAMALVVGVEDYKDYRLARWIRHCDRDAKAIGAFLRSPSGWNLPPYNLYLLCDREAMAHRIRETLQEIADRSAHQDTVLLYFSGLSFACRPGVMGEKKKSPAGKPAKGAPALEKEIVAALLPYDATFDGPFATGISVEELGAWTEKIKAGNLIVILETAFDSFGSGRSLTREKIRGPRLPLEAGFPWARFPRREGLTLLVSTNPGEAALVIPPAKSGMFTWFLLDAATDDRFAADKNKDGSITLKELFSAATKEMKTFLALNTAVQTPAMCGGPFGSVVFAGKGAGTYSPPRTKKTVKETEEGKDTGKTRGAEPKKK